MVENHRNGVSDFSVPNRYETYIELIKIKPLLFNIQLSEIDWQHLLNLAIIHRTIPFLHHNLKQNQTREIPPQFHQSLSDLIRIHTKQVLSMNFELVRALKILSQHKICVIPYKGLVLSLVAYGDNNLRSFDDLDILVTEEDYFKPKMILSAHGYCTLPYDTLSDRESDQLRYYMGEYAMVREKNSICIDIHRRPLGNGDLTLFGDLPQLWNRLITITIAGKEIQTFSHSDLLIYLCMNGFKDGWEILRSVCDVAGILQRQAEHLEWDYILSETRHLKIDRIISFGLLLAHQLLEAPIPEDVLAHIKRDRSTTWLVDRVCRKFMYEFETLKSRNPIEALILKWVGLKYGSARRKYICGSIERVIKFSLAINYRDTDIIHLPKPLHFLYYLIRPLRILRDYRQNIFKFLVK
jgi:hypothetical protein